MFESAQVAVSVGGYDCSVLWRAEDMDPFARFKETPVGLYLLAADGIDDSAAGMSLTAIAHDLVDLPLVYGAVRHSLAGVVGDAIH